MGNLVWHYNDFSVVKFIHNKIENSYLWTVYSP